MTKIRTLPFSKCPVASAFQYPVQQKTSIFPPIQQKSLKSTLNTLNYDNNLFFMKSMAPAEFINTRCGEDYTAEVSTIGKTIRNEDIARCIIEYENPLIIR